MFTLRTWYAPPSGTHEQADKAQEEYEGSQWRRPMVMARLSRVDVEPYDLGVDAGKALNRREVGDRVLFLRHIFEQRPGIDDAHTGDLRLQSTFGWYKAKQWLASVMLPFWRGVRDQVDAIDGIECEYEKQRGPYTYETLDAWADDALPLLTNQQVNKAMPTVLRNVTRAQLVGTPSLISAYAQWTLRHRADAIRECVVQPAARLFGVVVPVGNWYDYEPAYPTAMGIGRPELYFDPAAYTNNGFKALIAARNRAVEAGTKSTGWWCQREPRSVQVMADPSSACLQLLGHLVSTGVPHLNYWARSETDDDRAAIDEWCDENVGRLVPPKRIRGLKAAALDATELQTAGMISYASDSVWLASLPGDPL